MIQDPAMTQPALLSLACNACGAPLKVHAGIRYLTCARCGTQLQIHQDTSALFTEAMEQVQSQTASLAAEVARLRLQQEIEALDREWSARREVLCTRDRSGQLSEPTTASAWISGSAGSVMGLVWMVATSSAGNSFMLGLPGLGIALVSVLSAVRMQSRAHAFQSAREDHLRRRAALLEALQVAGTPAAPEGTS